MRVLALREINDKYFNANSVARAQKLKDYVVLEYAGKNTGFMVVDPERRSKHSVINFSSKKEPNDWQCDCAWYSNKGTYCAHILAVHYKLNEQIMEESDK